MAEHRKLFEKAASEQWFPVAERMAKVIKRVESHSTDIPASEIVNVDLEVGPHSKVLQIGLANLEGARALDCLTRYSEGVIAPSSSRLLVQASYQLKRFEKKVKALPSHDGILDAKRVVGKLREIGISKKTIFLTWASWASIHCFDWLHRNLRWDRGEAAVAGIAQHHQSAHHHLDPRRLIEGIYLPGHEYSEGSVLLPTSITMSSNLQPIFADKYRASQFD
jgi:hypothetical protein